MSSSPATDQASGKMRIIPGVTFKHPGPPQPSLLDLAQERAAASGEPRPSDPKGRGKARPATNTTTTASPARKPKPAPVKDQSEEHLPVVMGPLHQQLLLLIGLGFTNSEAQKHLGIRNKERVHRLRRDCTRGLPFKTMPCAIVHHVQSEDLTAAISSPKPEVAQRAATTLAAVQLVTSGRRRIDPGDITNLCDFTAHYTSYQGERPGSECGALTGLAFQLDLEWPISLILVAASADLLTPEILVANAPSAPSLRIDA